MNIPKKVSDRLSKSVAQFQKVLADAKGRDVHESDTVTIVQDILSDVFGFDKYSEITSEQAIRGTYCDLAVKIGDAIQLLIEVKAIGLDLKDNHLRQAIGYGANQGVQWVVLTNGITWEVYKLLFEKPLGHELVFAFDFLELSPRKKEDQEPLYLLCREGLAKDAIHAYHKRVQAVNRFVVAAIIQSDVVSHVIRRELKRLAPDSKVGLEEVQALLPDVLKRDVLEGEVAERARRQVAKASSKMLRKVPKPSSARPGATGS